jgi:hypothetical protein
MTSDRADNPTSGTRHLGGETLESWLPPPKSGREFSLRTPRKSANLANAPLAT